MGVKVYFLSSWRALHALGLMCCRDGVMEKKMDSGSTDPHYGKEFILTLFVVIFTLGAAIFLSATWLTLIGYWAWVVFHWIVA